MEQGETECQTAVRELQEESGLEAKEEDITLIGRFFYEFKDTSVAKHIIHVPVYAAKKFTGNTR